MFQGGYHGSDTMLNLCYLGGRIGENNKKIEILLIMNKIEYLKLLLKR
jgi:hypothetical protein